MQGRQLRARFRVSAQSACLAGVGVLRDLMAKRNAVGGSRKVSWKGWAHPLRRQVRRPRARADEVGGQHFVEGIAREGPNLRRAEVEQRQHGFAC